MINNKNYTRDQLKEILEDELFQNLLFHTANRHRNRKLNKACSKSKLTDQEFKNINRGIRLIGSGDLKPREYFVLVALYYLKDEIDKAVENLEKFLEAYDEPIKKNMIDFLTEYAFKMANETIYFEEEGFIYHTALHLYTTEKYDEAIPIFEKVLQNSNKEREWHSLYFLVSCNLSLNQFDKAMEYFNKISTLYPDNQIVHNLFGEYYCKTKDYDKALEHYKILKHYFDQVSKDEKDFFEYGYIGLIICYSKKGKIDQIIEDIKQHLLLEPDSYGLLYSLANCYYTKKDYDKVFDIIDKALSINPYNFESLSMLANCYYEKESYNRAIYYYKETIRVKCDSCNYIKQLGLSYIKIKDFDQAIRIFQFILSIWSKDGLAYFVLGKIYEQLGQNDLASEYFEKASTFKPFYIDEYEKIVFK